MLAMMASLLVSACGQPPVPSVAESAPPTTGNLPEAPAVSTAATIDPDGPDWAHSLPWLAGAPCRAQAQMLYTQIGARRRGASLEDQMQAYANSDELGPGKTAMLPQLRAQLEKLYAAETTQLELLPPAVAAECLALQPPVNVSRERALECHMRYMHPTHRMLYTSATPPSHDQAATADHQFHRCLRGTL